MEVEEPETGRVEGSVSSRAVLRLDDDRVNALALVAPEPEDELVPGYGTAFAFGTASRVNGVSGTTVEGTEPDAGPVEYMGAAVVAGPTTVEGAP